MKYLVRDPYFKSMLMNMLYMLAVMCIAFLRPAHGGSMHVGAGGLWFVTAMLLYIGSTYSFNHFGTEGSAATTLFLYPSSRRQMIIGKNLVLYPAFTMVYLLIILLLSLFTHNLALAPRMLALVFIASVVFTAVGNIVSIMLPYRIVMRGWRMQQQSAGQGCARTLPTLGFSLCGLLLALPVAAAVIVPTYWVAPTWILPALALAVIYAAGLYLYSLRLGERMLQERELAVIASLSADE